jgi:hypothetical protein
MMRFLIIIAALMIAVDATAEASPSRRYRRISTVSLTPGPVPVQAQHQPKVTQTESIVTVVKGNVTAVKGNVTAVKGNDDALAEVNAARARRGLRPFLPDPLLNQAARTCAKIRAASRIEGHLPSDFAHLPSGASATSAGCGALEPSWGWGTCCTYDNYNYAGAAWVMGADGQRYMHLFVR